LKNSVENDNMKNNYDVAFTGGLSMGVLLMTLLFLLGVIPSINSARRDTLCRELLNPSPSFYEETTVDTVNIVRVYPYCAERLGSD
jgi:hypothetical protein